MTNLIKLDFNGSLVGFDDNGWVNATGIAKKFGKEPYDWLRQADTLEYLLALYNALGFKSVSRTDFNIINKLVGGTGSFKRNVFNLSKKTGLVKTKSGSPKNGGGTWLHPKLAVAFARWLSYEFAVWCDLTIDSLINKTTVTYEKVKNMLSMGFDEAKQIASLSGKTLRKYRDAKPILKERQMKLLLS